MSNIRSVRDLEGRLIKREEEKKLPEDQKPGSGYSVPLSVCGRGSMKRIQEDITEREESSSSSRDLYEAMWTFYLLMDKTGGRITNIVNQDLGFV